MTARPAPLPALLPALLALAASGAGAEELLLDLRAKALYTDREVSAETGLDFEEWSFRGGPGIEGRDGEGDLTWSLRYQPSYEYFTQTHELSGWDHDLWAEGEWRISPQTSVSVGDRFSRYRNEARFNESLVDETGSFLVERADVRRFIRNVADVELRHQLSPVQQLLFSASHTLYDYSDEDRVDRNNLGVAAQYLYSLTPRNTVGVTGSWRRQEFEELGAIPERHTDFYNVSLRWIYRFDPTLTLNVSAGPTWVESDSGREVPQSFMGSRFPLSVRGGEATLTKASTCPIVEGQLVIGRGCQGIDLRSSDEIVGAMMDLADNVIIVLPDEQVTVGLLEDPPSSADNRLTYFADISLTKSWEQWDAVLAYQRRDDTTSGLGVSTIADIGRASVSYRPSVRWTFSLSGSYVRQTQSQEGFQLATVVRGTTQTLNTFQPTPPGTPFPFVPGMITINDVAELVGVQPVEVDADLRIDTWVAAFQARYRLTKRLTLIGELFYLEETQKGDFRTGNELERFRGALGFIYEFEPIRL